MTNTNLSTVTKTGNQNYIIDGYRTRVINTYLTSNNLLNPFGIGGRAISLNSAPGAIIQFTNYITVPNAQTGEAVSIQYYSNNGIAIGSNILAQLQPPVGTDGTYVLKCTITDGVPAFSWVLEQ